MNSLELQNRLEGVNVKLRDFFNNYREIRTEVEKLKSENTKLKSDLDKANKDLQHFQNKHKIGKLVSDLDEEGVKNTELKNLLDRYIDEIDHCIELMRD